MSKELKRQQAVRDTAVRGIRSRSKTGMPLDKNGKVIIALVGDATHRSHIMGLNINGQGKAIHNNPNIRESFENKVNNAKMQIIERAITFAERYSSSKNLRSKKA
jgi:hypothetical protein